ncbi:MAG: sugar-binding protein, partial [Lentisphaeria bacterium]|nr:sugar-binding protein [Lentisphaeria bacterium]
PLHCQNQAVANEEERQAFADWAEFMAREYRDSVTFWEVWNEPNIAGFWKPQPNAKDYALLLKATYAAVKRGNPDAQVVAMSTAGIDLAFIEAVLAEGTVGHFDAISVHPYRYPTAPEAGKTTMLDHFRQLVQLLDRFGAKGVPIYNTEVGWPNQDDPRGLPEQTSANYLARMYVQLHAIPQIRATFWYDFQNDGQQREYNEHNFGLLHNDFTPKAPAVAYRMTALALRGRRFVREWDTGDPNTRAYLFAGADGTHVVAAWSLAGTGALSTIWKTGTVQTISAAGPVRQIAAPDGNLVLELGETPVFAMGLGEVEMGRAALAGEGAWTVPGRELRLPLTLRNSLPTAVAGSLRIDAPEGWQVKGGTAILLERRATKHLELVVQPPPDTATGKTHPVRCRWIAKDDRFLGALTLPVEVRAAADLSLAYQPSSHTLRLAGSSPLKPPPAIDRATLRLRFPDGREATQEVTEHLAWETPGRFLRRAAAPTLAADLVCPEIGAGPTVAELTVEFADLPAAATRCEANLWSVPRAAITVDAKTGDWLGMTKVALTEFDGPGKDRWTGPSDATATLALARDLDGLHLWIEVTDDILAQPESGGNVWQGDGIQLSLAPVDGKPEDRIEIGLALTNAGPEAYRWTQKAGLLDSIPLHIVREETTTRYEATLPWTILGDRPQPGELRRFALVVNDRDDQDREGWLRLFDGVGWRKDSTQHGILLFP